MAKVNDKMVSGMVAVRPGRSIFQKESARIPISLSLINIPPCCLKRHSHLTDFQERTYDTISGQEFQAVSRFSDHVLSVQMYLPAEYLLQFFRRPADFGESGKNNMAAIHGAAAIKG